MNAEQFIAALQAHSTTQAVEQYKIYYATQTPKVTDTFMGVPMGTVFALSKKFVDLSPTELKKMLDSPVHEVKAGALSAMDKQAALKKTSAERLGELYDLYIARTNRINDWRLVDVSCRYTMGRYLFDKPRDVLYKLARSKSLWERRIAIISTWYFISKGDTADTFKIAQLLLGDNQEPVQKAVGWMLREAGNKDHQALIKFLDKNAASMPPIILRSAIERFSKDEKAAYSRIKK